MDGWELKDWRRRIEGNEMQGRRSEKWEEKGWEEKVMKGERRRRWNISDDENGGENGSIYRCCSTPVTAVTLHYWQLLHDPLSEMMSSLTKQ